LIPPVATNHPLDKSAAATTRALVNAFFHPAIRESRISSTWHTTSKITVIASAINVKNHTPLSASGMSDGSLWCDLLATQGSIQIFSAAKRHTVAEATHAIFSMGLPVLAMLRRIIHYSR
jgi:hypothetical protein